MAKVSILPEFSNSVRALKKGLSSQIFYFSSDDELPYRWQWHQGIHGLHLKGICEFFQCQGKQYLLFR